MEKEKHISKSLVNKIKLLLLHFKRIPTCIFILNKYDP